MKRKVLGWVSLGLCVASSAVQAGVVTFTDIDAFRSAAGPLVEIDFNTLPDGTPSPDSVPVEITAEFNYTDLGVTFSVPVGDLRIIGSGEHDLLAVVESSSHSWIEGDFAPAVYAVGFTDGALFGPYLSVLDAQHRLLAESRSLNGFVGVVSDVPIQLAIIDENTSGVGIGSILFTPVPEPASLLLLLSAGAFACARRR